MNLTAWQAGGAAFVAVLILVPVVRIVCARFGIYDLPGPLKIHTRPIPRLGGIAVGFGLLAGGIASGEPAAGFWYCVAAFALIWLSGMIDDIRVRGFHPALRFTAQVLAAMLLWQGGWRLLPFDKAPLNAAATCLFVVAFVNAFNFLDGADGIAAGVTALIAIGYTALPSGMQSGLGNIAAWSLLGACVAFLASNFPPASLFLGDSGSAVLGFSVALLGIDLYQINGLAKAPLLFPIVIAAIPLLDAGLAIVRRIRDRRWPFRGDRRHFYDLLLARGWTARRVAVTCYGLTAGLVGAGWLMLRAGLPVAFLECGLIFAVLLAGAVRLGSLRVDGNTEGGPAQNPARSFTKAGIDAGTETGTDADEAQSERQTA